jgi:hypothetical protein
MSLAAATAIVAVPAALAQPNGPARTNGSPGSAVGGQIEVDGAGSVLVTGSFLAFGDVGGMKVVVTDRAGDARVILAGQRMAFPRRPAGRNQAKVRTLAFQPGAKQRVSIEGRNTVASFRGNGNVTLSITGRGTVRLDGVGTFRVNSKRAESWPMVPITLPLRSTPRGPR